MMELLEIVKVNWEDKDNIVDCTFRSHLQQSGVHMQLWEESKVINAYKCVK